MGILGGVSSKRLFKTILANSRERLYRMAYSWTHDPALADDLVQQTCYQALRKQRHLRDIDAADAWLFRILANCLADHYRTRREVFCADELVMVDKRTPERATQEDQVAQRVRIAVSELPLNHRQVVTLVDLEGFSYAAVAGILDIPVGTVMSRLSRGRGALRDILLDANAREDMSIHSKVRRIK
jgi:RNA polymerase sigma-70 factor (ECF subfamily)